MNQTPLTSFEIKAWESFFESSISTDLTSYCHYKLFALPTVLKAEIKLQSHLYFVLFLCWDEDDDDGD